MVMNNIIFFGDSNYSKGHCNFTATMTIHLQMRTKTATRTSEWATAALDGLCRACILQPDAIGARFGL